VNPNVVLCQQVDHGKSHKKHGLGAWWNSAVLKGVLTTTLKGWLRGYLRAN
jgi:hypothetical protein